MAVAQKSRERPQKILVAMYELSGGTTSLLKYEDIVVTAFKLFPDEFALRGYPEFPDSSDIHKPLYGPLKSSGLVRSGNKKFGLTSKGVDEARALVTAAGDRLGEERQARRLTRDEEREVERMLASPAVRLFNEGDREKILDTDFFSFVGCTVRTPRKDFQGRLARTEDAIDSAVALGKPDPEAARVLGEVWASLKADFSRIISMQGGRAK